VSNMRAGQSLSVGLEGEQNTSSLGGGRVMTPSQTPLLSEQSPRSVLQNMIGGFRVTQMISVAAKLRIADQLADGPKNMPELAHATRCHEDSLYRLLRRFSFHWDLCGGTARGFASRHRRSSFAAV
jgi:hypothetical protein